jgi:hypothetical protein
VNNDELLFEVASGLTTANLVAQSAWNNKVLPHLDSVKLCTALRAALAAATELQSRAGGVPPPRRGD